MMEYLTAELFTDLNLLFHKLWQLQDTQEIDL